MVDVPAVMPVTSPVVLPIVATAGVALLHVPPPMASLSVLVAPTHIPVMPVMGAVALTVMVLVAIHVPIA
jgi:hypothetical protein